MLGIDERVQWDDALPSQVIGGKCACEKLRMVICRRTIMIVREFWLSALFAKWGGEGMRWFERPALLRISYLNSWLRWVWGRLARKCSLNTVAH